MYGYSIFFIWIIPRDSPKNYSKDSLSSSLLFVAPVFEDPFEKISSKKIFGKRKKK